MNGLMMDFQLTLPPLLRRAETLLRRPGGRLAAPGQELPPLHVPRHGAAARKQLAVALQKLGLERGDRVATLCWNHYQHLEAYFGIPCGGFVLHTLNLRLHPDDLGYIAKHGERQGRDRRPQLLPLLEQFKDRTKIEHVFVVEDSYEELLDTAERGRVARPAARRARGGSDVLHERHDRAPKGVVYSHRSTVLHALGVATTSRSACVSRTATRCCPSCRCSTRTRGATRTCGDARHEARVPGPHLDPESLLEDFVAGEGHAGRQACRRSGSGCCRLLDANPGKWDLSQMKGMLVGGSAVAARDDRRVQGAARARASCRAGA